MKKTLLWIGAVALFAALSVPSLMADGNPTGPPPKNGGIVIHPPV